MTKAVWLWDGTVVATVTTLKESPAEGGELAYIARADVRRHGDIFEQKVYDENLAHSIVYAKLRLLGYATDTKCTCITHYVKLS